MSHKLDRIANLDQPQFDILYNVNLNVWSVALVGQVDSSLLAVAAVAAKPAVVAVVEQAQVVAAEPSGFLA